MNKDFLKEMVRHGTEEYTYAQYHVRDLLYPFYMSYHWHNEIEIIYIKKGNLKIIIDDKEYNGVENDVFVVNPGQIHMMTTSDLSVDYYTILFDINLIEFEQKDEMNTYLTAIRNEELRLATYVNECASYKKILAYLKEICALNEEKNKLYMLDTKLRILLIIRVLLENYMADSAGNVYGGKNIAIKREILTYIENNYSSKISLGDIADIVHMSEKYFSRFFKENFGVTFVEYVNSVRLEKAAVLLNTTDDSVTEVALQCGYTNISYFIRSFKKSFNVSPHKFKNRK
ncbi:MAG: helix-turn-helix domain-containing protein [Lachnospiraceae bacterium]|nr:helix-turn-helix domain-containing protein [Lachnospiraceae bacterium]